MLTERQQQLLLDAVILLDAAHAAHPDSPELDAVHNQAVAVLDEFWETIGMTQEQKDEVIQSGGTKPPQ